MSRRKRMMKDLDQDIRDYIEREFLKIKCRRVSKCRNSVPTVARDDFTRDDFA